MMEIDYREIRESFVTTSREILRQAETLLLEMEKVFDAEKTVVLLRGLHTIKGNAGIFELDAVIALCHALESRVEEMQASSSAPEQKFIDLALTALDKIQALITAIEDKPRYAQVDYQGTLARLTGNAAVVPKDAETTAALPKTKLDWIQKKTQHVKLPEKYYTLAKNTNSFLSFVALDLGDQTNTTAKGFLEKLQSLHREKSLLSFGTLRKEEHLSVDAPLFMPYFLILCTLGPVAERLKRLELKTLFCHIFFEPVNVVHSAEPVVSGEFTANSENTARETHLKVNISLLNSLIEITGEIVLARNALVRRAESENDPSFTAIAKKFSYLVSDLQDKVMRTRLQGLGILFQRFPRLVRETAVATGKKAELHTSGSDIELDKAIIDEIADPLVHIIRNAVDHGIEVPEARLRAGKEETGSIHVTAAMREGNIVITVADDGNGLNYDNIRDLAINRGLISREKAHNASEQEISDYLFLPGFSTRAEVTTISGRGVGMDVVRNNVKKLGGSVEISGKSGEGTIVTLVIPQTLSILTCLVIETGGARFVIPQQNIVEVVAIEAHKLNSIQNKQTYELRSRLLPLVDTNALIGLTESAPKVFLVLKTEKYHYGLTVDRILETEEVVVKPLPPFNQEWQIFAGAAIMGDAKIALIFDAAGIGRYANLQAMDADRSVKATQLLPQQAPSRYLLFKSAARQVAFKVFQNPRIERIDAATIETIVGRKFVNYRGEIIPVISLDFMNAGSSTADAELCFIILQADNAKYGMLVAEVLDVLSDTLTICADENTRPEIEGLAIVNDTTVVVLNMPYLLQSVGKKPAELATKRLQGVA